MVLFLASCAVAPDYERPAPPEASGYTPELLAAQTASADVAGGAAQNFVEGSDIPGQWWTLFTPRRSRSSRCAVFQEERHRLVLGGERDALPRDRR
jgi:hypothetical protein